MRLLLVLLTTPTLNLYPRTLRVDPEKRAPLVLQAQI